MRTRVLPGAALLLMAGCLWAAPASATASGIPQPADSLTMSSEQAAWIEGMLPGWLSRLRRSDPGLDPADFRLAYTASFERHRSPCWPSVGPDSLPRPREATDLSGTICTNPELAFHPAKWKAGLLSASPGGRYIIDLGADIEVSPEGDLGGDCGGGWALYDGRTHEHLWGTTPGNGVNARSAAWAGEDVVILYGNTMADRGTAELDRFVPTFWIMDITNGRYTRWDGPPGPQ